MAKKPTNPRGRKPRHDAAAPTDFPFAMKLPELPLNGRYWTRTSDLIRVNEPAAGINGAGESTYNDAHDGGTSGPTETASDNADTGKLGEPVDITLEFNRSLQRFTPTDPAPTESERAATVGKLAALWNRTPAAGDDYGGDE
ncbi:MAG: hypothetical protein KAY37_11120 [Phycisphaerae bacterium]|nr:hypothetical protein [Phycisphaerae bacterium]